MVGEVRQEEIVYLAWLTGMLTGTATNAPKSFPKRPDELLKKNTPEKPMTPKQWQSWMHYVSDGVILKEPPKKNRAEPAPQQGINGN